MIGYHYTTKAAWTKITKEGLVPQPLNKPFINRMILDATKRDPGNILACWVWERPQIGVTGLGHIMMIHKHHKEEEEFVELQVEFDPLTESLQLPEHQGNPQNIQIYHDGTIDFGQRTIRYHENEPVKLVTVTIPPERIQLLEQYNFSEVKQKLKIHFDIVDTSAKSDILREDNSPFFEL